MFISMLNLTDDTQLYRALPTDRNMVVEILKEGLEEVMMRWMLVVFRFTS